MSRYLVRRLLAMVLVLFAAVTLSFAVMQALPGDPVDQMLGGNVSGVQATPAQKAELRHELGLDLPLGEQYLRFLGHAVRGDFGRSIGTGQPATDAVAQAAPASLELLAVAFPLTLLLGVGAAILATLTRSRALSAALSFGSVLGASMPSYWVGVMLIELFSFDLPVFPATGDDGLGSLVLPAVALALPGAGVVAQVLSASLRATLAEPYITTVQAKGASRIRVNVAHALPNAALPAVTVLGTLIGALLGGAAIVEIVFGRQGLGRLLVTAIEQRDMPVVQAMVCFIGAGYVVLNLLVDLAYARLDPRIVVVGRPRDAIA